MTLTRPKPVELAARIAALQKAVRAGRAVPAGRLYGLPELPDHGCWVDIAGAAALTGVSPKTITGWLNRGGPLRNPFPSPHRILYRLYWPRADIEAWRAREQPPSGEQ
jgi:predicted DNA-binding transcriptional regulator AlpA